MGLLLTLVIALLIGFRLTKIGPLVGGLICGAAHFLYGIFSISAFAGELGGPDPMMTAFVLELMLSTLIAIVSAAGIFVIRRLR